MLWFNFEDFSAYRVSKKEKKFTEDEAEDELSAERVVRFVRI